MSEIININEDWQLHSGGEVQAFVKKMLGDLDRGLASKIGWIARAPKTVEGVEKEYMFAFATRDDYEVWVANPESVTPILDFELPSGGGGGAIVRYVASLVANPDAVIPRVVIEQSLDVELRFTSKVYSDGQYLNMGEPGTVTFYRSTDGGQNWSIVGTAPILSSEAEYTPFDIWPYLVRDRETLIRAKASFTYNSNSIETDVWVTFPGITYTELSVKNMTNYTRPLRTDSGYISLDFSVLGAVDKTLHVRVGGAGVYLPDVNQAVSFTKDIDRTTEYSDTNPTGITISNAMAMAHGVHTVKAWVTCDDGNGNELTSDMVINRFMVVNGSASTAELSQPRLILQAVNNPISNYVYSKIASLAVWIPDPLNPMQPSSEPISLIIRLTDEDNKEYYHNEPSVSNNTTYDIRATVEIEGDEDTYYTRLSIYWGDTNIMQASLNRAFLPIEVDNSESYTSVPGADFVLNPKNRDNGESNPRSIINQANGREVPGCTFEGFNGQTDLWVTTTNGQKVLRVLAGSQLVINYEPFLELINDGSAPMTLELDFAVRNITQEDEPMIDVCQEVNSELLGLRMLPLDGIIKCANYQINDTQNFSWQEGVRTHLTLVLNPSVTVKAADELTWQRTWNNSVSRPLSLAKVYLNAVPCRELVYANNQAETAEGRLPAAGIWCRGAGHGGIKIGNPHADIDIYGIRCYRSALSAEFVRQDYIASLPDAASKVAVKTRNDITTNGRIDYIKAKDKGYRCLTLVGQDQYKGNQDKKNGYPCYWRIDHDDPRLSGTIGMAAYLAYVSGTLGDKQCMKVTAQGTTANTYWDNNEQTKIDGITYKVTIPFSKVHSDFGWTADMSTGADCECPMYLNGNRIEGAEYASLTAEQKALVMIEVLDGWFDGNGWSEYAEEMGMYHGQIYTSYIGGAKCTKLVNKINVASSMQSHKMGATRLYHDVMMKVTGGNSLTRNGARYAVYEECFMLFTEHPDDGGKVEFRGLCTFGNGKFDKAVFGYKANSNTFAFEGLQNNIPLCDFRIPADDKVTYDPDKESWMYAGTKSFEYGLGKTQTIGGKKHPTATAEAAFRRFVNFIYCHNTSLRYFNGNRDAFNVAWNDADADTRNEMVNYQYWCRSDFRLLRYDFTTQAWVDAGTWDQENLTYNAGVRDLRTDPMTAAAYTQWQNSQDYGYYDRLNEYFINAIANHGRTHFGSVADVENFKTHYNVVSFLLAGTDNGGKNMYYQYDPETGLIFLDGDDLDSILPTDNNGNNTKVYFLDRIHDVQDWLDGHKPQVDYESRASALFNFIEAAYELYSNELRENMGQVLQAMVELCGGNNASVMGCIEKYFFSIQTYFPEVAWSEQARLRYEWPKSFGYTSTGEQSRGIDPITQQVGNQLEGERQYMRRRLALIASYAAWGQFRVSNTGSTGLSDAGASLSMVPGKNRTGNNYTFDLVAHQWIYPVGTMGNTLVDPHIRAVPGVPTRFVNYSPNPLGGDQAAVLAASNYYRSFGNLGDMVIGNDALSVPANRLTEFVVEPSEGSEAFQPGRIDLATPNLMRLSLNGCSAIGGSMDLSALTKLVYLDLRGTSLTSVSLPRAGSLTEIHLPSAMAEVNIDGQRSLTTLDVEGGGSYLTRIVIRNAPQLDSLSLIRGALTAGAPLESIIIEGVDWAAVQVRDVVRLANMGAIITGRIGLTGTPSLADRLALISRYGKIDDPDNPLYIYGYTLVDVDSISISGEPRVGEVGDYQYSLNVEQIGANNISSISWGISENDYATIDASGVLRVHTKPPYNVPSSVARITCTVVANGGTQMQATLDIGLYERKAQVADLVYHDGTFGPISEFVTGRKAVVGICFYSEDYPDGNGGWKHDRRMVALRPLSSRQWGPMNSLASNNGSYGPDTGYTPIVDARYNGWGGTDSGPALTNENYLDSQGNYRVFQGNNEANDDAPGDMNLFELPHSMGSYVAGDKIPLSLYRNLQLREHRNNVVAFDGYPFKSLIDERQLAYPPTTPLQLNALMTAFQTLGTNYDSYLYPPCSYCEVYEPNIGEFPLDSKFRRGRWYLAGAGEMLRIVWLLMNANDNGFRLYSAFMPPSGNVWSISESSYQLYYRAWLVNFSSRNVLSSNKNNSNGILPVCLF